MPIVEEKLISPFAIHFSQARIRSTFRDGGLVEASCSQIKAQARSIGGYDVILQAPFPMIEITRWSSKDDSDSASSGSEAGQKEGASSPQPRAQRVERWFSFDNRRLYCLQKAAAAHWPKKVGVIVEVGHESDWVAMQHKCDTKTSGRSVIMAHHHDIDPVLTWDWLRVIAGEHLANADSQASLEAIEADMAKKTWHELVDAPPAHGSLMAIALGYGVLEQEVTFEKYEPCVGQSFPQQKSAGEPVVRSGIAHKATKQKNWPHTQVKDDASIHDSHHVPSKVAPRRSQRRGGGRAGCDSFSHCMKRIPVPCNVY